MGFATSGNRPFKARKPKPFRHYRELRLKVDSDGTVELHADSCYANMNRKEVVKLIKWLIMANLYLFEKYERKDSPVGSSTLTGGEDK